MSRYTSLSRLSRLLPPSSKFAFSRSSTCITTGTTTVSQSEPPTTGKLGMTTDIEAHVEHLPVRPIDITYSPIDLLSHQHREAEQLYSRCLGSQAMDLKKEALKSLCIILRVHSIIEEQHLYPAVIKVVGADESLKGQQDHKKIDELVLKLHTWTENPSKDFPVEDVKTLMELVELHTEDEEQTIFPGMENKMSAREFGELGKTLLLAKEAALKNPF